MLVADARPVFGGCGVVVEPHAFECVGSEAAAKVGGDECRSGGALGHGGILEGEQFLVERAENAGAFVLCHRCELGDLHLGAVAVIAFDALVVKIGEHGAHGVLVAASAAGVEAGCDEVAYPFDEHGQGCRQRVVDLGNSFVAFGVRAVVDLGDERVAEAGEGGSPLVDEICLAALFLGYEGLGERVDEGVAQGAFRGNDTGIEKVEPWIVDVPGGVVDGRPFEAEGGSELLAVAGCEIPQFGLWVVDEKTGVVGGDKAGNDEACGLACARRGEKEDRDGFDEGDLLLAQETEVEVGARGADLLEFFHVVEIALVCEAGVAVQHEGGAVRVDAVGDVAEGHGGGEAEKQPHDGVQGGVVGRRREEVGPEDAEGRVEDGLDVSGKFVKDVDIEMGMAQGPGDERKEDGPEQEDEEGGDAGEGGPCIGHAALCEHVAGNVLHGDRSPRVGCWGCFPCRTILQVGKGRRKDDDDAARGCGAGREGPPGGRAGRVARGAAGSRRCGWREHLGRDGAVFGSGSCGAGAALVGQEAGLHRAEHGGMRG